MRRSYNFISTSVDKQTLKTFLPNDPCCNYFALLPLDVSNFEKDYHKREEDFLYLVKTEIRTAVQREFSTQLHAKPQRSADFCGLPRRSEAQTSSTAAPNTKDGPEC